MQNAISDDLTSASILLR